MVREGTRRDVGFRGVAPKAVGVFLSIDHEYAVEPEAGHLSFLLHLVDVGTMKTWCSRWRRDLGRGLLWNAEPLAGRSDKVDSKLSNPYCLWH
jgi:hypothetical protein